MPSEWWQLARQHWVIGGILVSLLWFLAGKQSLSNAEGLMPPKLESRLLGYPPFATIG
jgi:hypothetical protein